MNEKEHLVNDEIQKSGLSLAKTVRVIGPQGEQVGVLTLANALNAAYDKGLDLVLIAPGGDTPVVKIMDYGKFRFDRDKRKKEARKNQQRVDIKGQGQGSGRFPGQTDVPSGHWAGSAG